MQSDRKLSTLEPKQNPFVGQQTVSPFGGDRQANPFVTREVPRHPLTK